MVKAGPLEVNVVCIPVEFGLIGATMWKDFVAFDTKIYTWVKHGVTKEGIDGVPVRLTRSFNKGPWDTIGTTTSKELNGLHGYCEIPVSIKDAGEYAFHYHVQPNKYCYADSLVLTLFVRRKRTNMRIAATIGNPTPDQPYDIYGRLWAIEPEEKFLNGKTVKLYERPRDGTWSLIATLTTFTKVLAGESYDGWWEKKGLKKTSGIWEYQVEFEGNAEYEGCSEQHGLGASLGPAYFY